MADGSGGPPAFPTWGTGAGGSGGGQSYTPAPYGQSYGDNGLVYGIGSPNQFWQGGTSNLQAIQRASQFRPQSVVELGRAANWITGTLASDAERQRYLSYFQKFFPQGGSFEQYSALWSNAAQYAAQVNRDDPNARWSPWDALDRMWKMFSKNGGGGGGGSSYSSTSTQVHLTGADEAGATLDSALANLLGRTATDKEKKKFLAALNAAERANPTVTKTSGTTSASGSSTSRSTTTGTSVSPAARAQEFAQNEEGFAEYQIATTYMDAMLEALSSPVRI